MTSFNNKENACIFKNGTFSWDSEEVDNIVLKNINISIPASKLTIIVGPVGSGKTSLISAMLGEMIAVNGKVNWDSTNEFIGYVPQAPWLMNLSVQDNITFGFPFERKK